MKVFMTRNEDVFIPLKVRVARRASSARICSFRFTPTLYQPRSARFIGVRAVHQGRHQLGGQVPAQTQNASDQIGGVSKSGDRYLDHTMFDLIQTATINDSLKFGKEVLNRMGKINRLHKNRVDQAGFAVLKAPDIPSIPWKRRLSATLRRSASCAPAISSSRWQSRFWRASRLISPTARAGEPIEAGPGASPAIFADCRYKNTRQGACLLSSRVGCGGRI